MNKRTMVGTLAAVLAIAAGAGFAPGDGAEAASYYDYPLGARDLRLGDQGSDVQTLNWLLRAEALPVPPTVSFEPPTDSAVRSLQASAGLHADGVADRQTRKAIARRMPRAMSTWYGPGLWGRRTACGVVLTPATVGVAHRRLPCGTRVVFAFHGHWVPAQVIDRGPYTRGYRWDLTRALAAQLGMIRRGVARIRSGVAR